jgi:hypothetical protein
LHPALSNNSTSSKQQDQQAPQPEPPQPKGLVTSTPEERNAWVGTPLVVPGKICVLFKKNNLFHSILGDYRLKSLLEIKRLGEEPVAQHLLDSYLNTLRSMRNARKEVSGKHVRPDSILKTSTTTTTTTTMAVT